MEKIYSLFIALVWYALCIWDLGTNGIKIMIELSFRYETYYLWSNSGYIKMRIIVKSEKGIQNNNNSVKYISL